MLAPMTRDLAWGAALIALLVAMPSCRPRPDASRDARVVTLMLPPSERPFWDPIARAFEADHPGTQVELVEGPQSTDLREDLYTASLLARDPTFDLVYLDVTWTPKLAAAGWLLPLDDLLAAEEQARFLPAALAAGRFDGRLYRVPVRTDVGLLYHRRDWLDQAGLPPPETFAELARIARALQSPPRRWGFVWQGRQYEGLVCAFLEVLHGHGGFWIDPSVGAVGLDRPEAAAALSFLVDCLRGTPISPPGVATYQEEESRRIFQDGRAVFLRNWPYAWRLSQAEDSPLRGRVGAGAMVRAPGGRRAGTLGGWGLGISAFSPDPGPALAFIRAATSLDGQRALCAPTGYAPARADAYDDPELLAANPFLAELRRLHEHAVARPAVAGYALASDILQRHLSAALAGRRDPGDALRAAARETRAALAGPAGGPR
jgi:multiple sugar transport system substrate-binding protein